MAGGRESATFPPPGGVGAAEPGERSSDFGRRRECAAEARQRHGIARVLVHAAEQLSGLGLPAKLGRRHADW